MTTPLKVGMISLGCNKNRVDSETALGLLADHGYTFTGDPADVEAFRSTFENYLAFEYGFDEVKSFNDTVEMFADETYLKAYSLMVVYVQANSGTYRYGVESIFCDGENFTVEVEELKHPTEVTTDLAGWYIIIVVPDSMVNNCTDFDAIG